MENAKSNYVQAVQAKVESKKIGSCNFWKISNKILNIGKLPVPFIINNSEVISSKRDKAMISAMNLTSNSMVE